MTANPQSPPAGGTVRTSPAQVVVSLVSMLAGAALLVAVLAGYFLTGERYGESLGETRAGANLPVLTGSATVDGSHLRIHALDPREGAAVGLPFSPFDAARLTRLRIHIDGFHPANTQVSLVWRHSVDAPQIRSVRLPLQEGLNHVDLFRTPEWRGDVRRMLLLVHGSLPETLVIRSVDLLPPQPTVWQLASQVVGQWTAFEGWRAHSINFIFGGERNPLISPVLASALWITFSAAVYLLLSLVRRTPPSLIPLAAMVLAGWIALDARWQWDLMRQARLTHSEFAGTSPEQRRHSALDRSLHELAEIIRTQHAEPDTRVLIFSDRPNLNPDYYRRVRLHYHLLPLNAASVWSLPISQMPAPGDLVIVLENHTRLRFAEEQGALRWGLRQRLLAERLLEHPLASVYRVL